MSRWEPGARERLERAALELYDERGFEQTTVVEIAQRAGLTERTFSGTSSTSGRFCSGARANCSSFWCARSPMRLVP